MTLLIPFAMAAQLLTAAASFPVDTPTPRQRVRPKAVEVSDWYARRLSLHRKLSYVTLPVFGFQYAAGTQIWQKGPSAPEWALKGHRAGAATLAGIFTVNTVTGLWNLWDSRHTEQGRALRYSHALSMLVADAGFTWAGARLSEQAENDPSARKLHRTVALTSIGISVASGLMMKFLNR